MCKCLLKYITIIVIQVDLIYINQFNSNILASLLANYKQSKGVSPTTAVSWLLMNAKKDIINVKPQVDGNA